jgi:hypothetical protein
MQFELVHWKTLANGSSEADFNASAPVAEVLWQYAFCDHRMGSWMAEQCGSTL